MKKTTFISLFLATWTIFVFGHTQAGNRYPAKSEYVAAVNKGLRDPTKQDWYVTKSGYIAALDEELLDGAIYWAVFGDETEFDWFIASSPRVFPLKGGLRVRLEKFSYLHKVRIRPKGSTISIWTVRDAIRLEFPIYGS